MKSSYFRECKHYQFSQIKDKFGINSDELTERKINILKRYNIIKIVQNNKLEYDELSDQDFIAGEIKDDSSEYSYIFTFVGVILLDDLIILCYPKYIDNDEEPFLQLKTILKVIEKYNSKEQLVYLYNGNEQNCNFNMLSISLHVLQDYCENGLYTNQHEIVTTNGEGEILWDKTIDETFAYISDNQPYYLELQTSENTQDDSDFFRRLHASVVTHCSKMLSDSHLLDLFELPEQNISETPLEDFGDVNYISYRLDKEIKNQYITQKQILLKTLYTYIVEKNSNQLDCSFSLYGTNVFNLVWEKACGSLFCNIREKSWTIKKLINQKIINSDDFSENETKQSIQDFIEKPEWIIENESVNYTGDLIPDIVTLKKNDEKNTTLYILDGKYYLLNVDKSNKNLTGNPGVQDVIKQYVYNASLRTFIDKAKIECVANAFLIPALNSETEELPKNYGNVPYWSVQKSGFKELPTVQIIKLKPDIVWKHYLDNTQLTDDSWSFIKTQPTENYLYHNENDGSVLDPKNGRSHVLIGFLRKDYFEYLCNQKKSSLTKKNFIFYFYATDKLMRYPLHPYIDFCTKFIGYDKAKSKWINGKLYLNKSGRCKIDEISAEDLEKELEKTGYKKNRSNSAVITYYKVIVEDFNITEKPSNEILDFNGLNKKIKQNGLNDVLYSFSPKVIDV